MTNEEQEMSNSEQICDFFRKMADGLVINSKSADGQKDSNFRVEERALEQIVNDFGVGLPPLAHG